MGAALAKSAEHHGEAYNFGPPAHHNDTVLELVQAMSHHWEQVRWEDISTHGEQLYESGLLKLNCDKALHYLNWQAALSFPETVRMTAEWYRSYYEDSSKVREVTFAQIREYENLFSR